MNAESGAARRSTTPRCSRRRCGFRGTAVARRAQAAAPTFTKDVAPIFQEKCEACHRPDSIAPMSLVTYTEARPWARSIKARVVDRTMPPWHIDRTVGVRSSRTTFADRRESAPS